ncbi:hypothetical protein TNCV_631841 [Trichonephila clavipes]|nr:hypothetical protein TNCV_631841 [Trichonephila clavipes]
MDDNSPSYTTHPAIEFQDIEDIRVMDWLTISRDSNLIEHIWNVLGEEALFFMSLTQASSHTGPQNSTAS